VTASRNGEAPLPKMYCYKGQDSADAQAEWGGMAAALAATMGHLRMVGWRTWEDAGSDRHGLIAVDGQPKPLLFRLRHLRAEQGG
jgi:hypothetical protein